MRYMSTHTLHMHNLTELVQHSLVPRRTKGQSRYAAVRTTSAESGVLCMPRQTLQVPSGTLQLALWQLKSLPTHQNSALLASLFCSLKWYKYVAKGTAVDVIPGVAPIHDPSVTTFAARCRSHIEHFLPVVTSQNADKGSRLAISAKALFVKYSSMCHLVPLECEARATDFVKNVVVNSVLQLYSAVLSSCCISLLHTAHLQSCSMCRVQ